MAARPEDPAGFAEEQVQVSQVLQHQSADQQVECTGREGQRPVQVVNEEPDRGGPRLAAGLGQHALGEVHRRDARPGLGQPQGMAPGAGAQVEDGEAAHVTDGRPDHRSLQRLERVGVVVVDGRPAIVPDPHR
jgi:hypothetical protein